MCSVSMARTSAILRRRPTPRIRCSAIGSLRIPLTPAPSPRAERGRGPRSGRARVSRLPQLLAEEGGDRVERSAGRAFFVVDIDDFDVAARLAVVRDEPLGLVPGEVGIVVVIVMDDVGPSLDP